MRWGVGLTLLAAFVWSYWPTIVELVGEWQRVPDYSHGFLVLPLALFLLWERRDQKPEFAPHLYWPGLILIGLAGVMRVVAAKYFMFSLDGWSIPVWLGGLVLLLGGWRFFLWASPAVVFLFFMVPIPYRFENLLALPLQSISTKISVFGLQSLMQPAIAMGNTILLGEETLEVARACSGMRIFVGVAALAFVFLTLFPRPLVIKILLAVAILPIALLANSGRIILTGLLYQIGYSDLARHLTHDFAGWVMIPAAVVLFGLALWFLDRLYVAHETIDAKSLTQSAMD